MDPLSLLRPSCYLLLECFLATALLPFVVEEVVGVVAAPFEDCGVSTALMSVVVG